MQNMDGLTILCNAQNIYTGCSTSFFGQLGDGMLVDLLFLIKNPDGSFRQDFYKSIILYNSFFSPFPRLPSKEHSNCPSTLIQRQCNISTYYHKL